MQSLLEVISETNSWYSIEQTLVPFLLRSVGLSMDIQSEDTFVILQSGEYVFLDIPEVQKLGMIFESTPPLPLTLLCYILSSLLEAVYEHCQFVKGYSTSTDVAKFCGHLVWNLCNLTVQMLSQSSEHRSCTTGLLLPSLLKAFTFKSSFEACVQAKKCSISRCGKISAQLYSCWC